MKWSITVLVSFVALNAGAMQLPELDWTPRSDWRSVTAEFGAVGDGKADDTAALQKAFDSVENGTVLYLPAGTYRVTSTLLLKPEKRVIGVMIVGHGRATRLVWDGPDGKPLWHDHGVAHSRYVGLSFEGGNRASVGLHHLNGEGGFETEVDHRHMAFRNFKEAGILADGSPATAEVLIENALFENCGRGVAFTRFNDYNWTIAGCEFLDCGIGVECTHGNVYVRNCHFARSRQHDIRVHPEHGSSVRRCTSLGSREFLRFTGSVSPMTIQDCRVAGWTGPDGAVVLGGAPVVLFDCHFADGPDGDPPVNATRNGQRLVLSENSPRDAASLVRNAGNARIHTVPAGERGPSLTSPAQRFLKSSVVVPDTVFDAVVDFGAKGDGKTDDTAAIQSAIDAARKHGNGAIAYLPTGRYMLTDTIRIEGGGYTVGGSGFRCSLLWRGNEGGTMIRVHDPDRVTIENIAVGNHDAGPMNNGIDIRQTGSGTPSSVVYDAVFLYGMYQRDPFRKGLVLEGLGENCTVLLRHLQGNLRLVNCGRATVLGNATYEGSVVVQGNQPAAERDGLLGFMTRLATITTHGLYLRNNYSIVMSDFYVEQADSGLVFEGLPGEPAGRATIQGSKVDFTGSKQRGGAAVSLSIDNYQGTIVFGHNQFYPGDPARMRHSGDRPLDLVILANLFYRVAMELEQGPGLTLHRIGCESRGVIDGPGDEKIAFDPTDIITPETPAALSAALDDLRRLGALDLKLNHATEKAPL